MLSDASEQEQNILSAIRYLPNDVYLHRDFRLMPKRPMFGLRELYQPRQNGRPRHVGQLLMNRLQNIDYSKPVFVTSIRLCRPRRI